MACRATQRAAKRQHILAYLESRLADGRLSAASTARDLGMSRRWLHALLGESGMTFAGWIARRRLEEARRRLTDPRAHHLSVAAIAFEAGFNDVSTFNRRFRACYGTTPRALRRRGRTGVRSRPHAAA